MGRSSSGGNETSPLIQTSVWGTKGKVPDLLGSRWKRSRKQTKGKQLKSRRLESLQMRTWLGVQMCRTSNCSESPTAVHKDILSHCCLLSPTHWLSLKSLKEHFGSDSPLTCSFREKAWGESGLSAFRWRLPLTRSLLLPCVVAWFGSHSKQFNPVAFNTVTLNWHTSEFRLICLCSGYLEQFNRLGMKSDPDGSALTSLVLPKGAETAQLRWGPKEMKWQKVLEEPASTAQDQVANARWHYRKQHKKQLLSSLLAPAFAAPKIHLLTGWVEVLFVCCHTNI